MPKLVAITAIDSLNEPYLRGAIEVELYEDAIVLEHDEGHKFPSKAAWPGVKLALSACRTGRCKG